MADLPIIKNELGIGKFNLASLNRQIDEKIAMLPKDAKGAINGVVGSNGEAHVAVVFKKEIGGGELAWSLEATKLKENPGIDWQTQVSYKW